MLFEHPADGRTGSRVSLEQPCGDEQANAFMLLQCLCHLDLENSSGLGTNPEYSSPRVHFPGEVNYRCHQ